MSTISSDDPSTLEPSFKKNGDNRQNEDYKLNYHKAKLKFGMLLMDMNDAIREGDGSRLVNVYMFALCRNHNCKAK